MLAKVVDGQKVGRTLGFPTANLAFFNPEEMPPSGVYAVEVCVKEQRFRGLLSVGVRPTFDTLPKEKLAEVHILDFDRDIYGEIIEISILRFIREVRRFDTAEELRAQIQRDIEGANAY